MTREQTSMGEIARILRCLGLLLLVAPIACAQPEGSESAPERLPEVALGTWTPFSQGYRRAEDLIIDAETLTWGGCVREPYRVLRGGPSSWVIELPRAPRDCPFAGPPWRFWELEISRNEQNAQIFDLSLYMCGDAAEIQKPQGQRSCNWGILRKRVD